VRTSRRGASRGDGLLREMIEQQKEQTRAELARIEEHNRERLDMQRQHDEDVRRLERQVDEERLKRLEEKIADAGSRKDDEPADWKTLLLQLAVEKVKGGDEETADGLLKMVREEEGGSGVWTLVNNLADKAMENPAGAMQAFGAVTQMLGLARQPPAAPQDVHQQQQPQQQPAAPVPRTQLSDLQLVNGIGKALGAAIVADNDPAPYAEEIRDILEERPHLRASLETLLRQEDDALLAALSTDARVSFEALGRRPAKWVRDFRKALKCYGIGAEVAPPVGASANGHATTAPVQ
jgi:hypothetical protein